MAMVMNVGYEYAGLLPGVNGAKLIDLGLQLGGKSLALMLALTQEEEKIAILVQVHPTEE